jgi:hypothetical protein
MDGSYGLNFSSWISENCEGRKNGWNERVQAWSGTPHQKTPFAIGITSSATASYLAPKRKEKNEEN